MKTKENSKRILLTDEELMGVVGGLVQLVNPSSGNYDHTKYGCENAKTKKECAKLSEDNGDHCIWVSKQCKFSY